jgi:TonB family protein
VHSFPDVAVLSYAPGIELDVFFVRSHSGDVVIRFIGYAARRTAKDALPMVTQAALEANRIDPQPIVLDDATRAAVEAEVANHEWAPDYTGSRVYTWFKLCLDATGAITSLKARLTTSLSAQEAHAKAVAAWKFRPFMLGGQPSPVCSLVRIGDVGGLEDRIALPPMVPPSYDTETILHQAALGRRLAGRRLILPSDLVKQRLRESGINRVDATLMFCVTESGSVDGVQVMRSTGFASYDTLLVEGVAGWRYRPLSQSGRSVRSCGFVTFVYNHVQTGIKHGTTLHVR